MDTQEVINGKKKKKKKKKHSNYDKLVHQSAATGITKYQPKKKPNLYQMGIS